jgi:hypothetical protein
VNLSFGYDANISVGIVRDDYTGVFSGGGEKVSNLPNAGVANDNVFRYIVFDASRAVPTAPENRPASISAYVCIKY